MATTTVSSGGVSTQGNRTYLFGTSSGIDTSALVEVAYNQRTAEADKIDVKISKNTKKADAYTTLSTLSSAVQTSLANLRQSYGFSSTNTNYVFNARSGTMTTNNSTDPSKLLGVTIDPGTNLGSYQIEVIQKAKANRIGSDTSTDPTVALGATGSFTLGLAGGGSAAINVTSGMSLNDLSTAINASTATTGVSATVLKVSATSYQLVLTGTSTAKNVTISNVTGTNVLQNIGMTTAGNVAKNVLQTADQAILELDGVQITRDTNSISDLVPGLNLSILNAEAGTLIDLDIGNDSSSIKDTIVAFTDAYNELRDFIVSNQEVSSGGEVSEDSALFGDTIMKIVSDGIQPLLGAKYGTGGTSLSTLRELGITMDQTNKFVVDESILDAAILSNYDDIKAMFSTKTTSDNANFALLGNTSKQQSMSFAMTITANASGVTGVSVGGNSNLFDISGSSITGKAGTIYEGLKFAYIGTTNATVNFTMQQGLADLLSNTLDTYTNGTTGIIADAKLDLGDQNTDMAARATRIRERADDFREKLIDKYAGYESAIARSKSIIAQLKAILGTSDN